MELFLLNEITRQYLKKHRSSPTPSVMHPGWTIPTVFQYKETTMDNLEDTFIAMAAAVILRNVKNPDKKAALKKVMLKIFSTIRLTYAEDPDFQ